MFLSDLQNKDIISTKDGKIIGRIIDAEINSQGNIIYLIVEPKRKIFKFNSLLNETKIKMSDIVNFGSDVILVNI